MFYQAGKRWSEDLLLPRVQVLPHNVDEELLVSEAVQAWKDRLGTAKKEEPLKVETKKIETIVMIEMNEDKARLLGEFLFFAREWQGLGEHGDLAAELYRMLDESIGLEASPTPPWTTQ